MKKSSRFSYYRDTTLCVIRITMIIAVILTVLPSSTSLFGQKRPASLSTSAYAENAPFNFIVPIMNIDDPQSDIDLLKPYISANDTVIFPMDNYRNVTSLQNDIPELDLGTGGTNITSLLNAVSTLPSNIHYITYDYERGWSPEWTADFNRSMDYFSQLHEAANQAGRETITFPVFALGVRWDWGEVARNSDIMVVQVMNWQTGATKVPDELKPDTLGITLEELTLYLDQQIKEKSPDTKLYYQFGFYQTNNTDYVLSDLNRARCFGADGVTLVHNVGISGNTSNAALAADVFEKYRAQESASPCEAVDGIDNTSNDLDNDGIMNSEDNCLREANSDQVDSDADGIGDECDIDSDGDGIINFVDNCSTVPNSDQADSTASGHFGPSTNYDIGGIPRFVATADFNNDTRPDIVTANPGTDNISILLSNGDGTFGESIEYSVNGRRPSFAALADFNNDGKADVVTANSGSNNTSILLGKGDGTFQKATTFATGGGTMSIAAADFNNDGKMDIVTANSLSRDVSLLLGDGKGSFVTHYNYLVIVSPSSIAAADFNNDGKMDVVTAGAGAGKVVVMLGKGNGTFNTPVAFNTQSKPFAVATADFNNDGKQDIVTANPGTDNISILLSKGDGTFQNAVNYGVGDGPLFIATADFDNDGNIDLATADSLAHQISVLMGNSDGTFRSSLEYDTGNLPPSISIADYNLDGKLDIVTASNGAYAISILLGSGDGIGDACVDVDGDGIELSADRTLSDNCPTVANANQADFDGDGIGNVCDSDFDGDSIANNLDNCPTVANANQADVDGDLIGDACDTITASSINPPYYREVFAPAYVSAAISGGDGKGIEVKDGAVITNIMAKSCESGSCSKTNSMNYGFDSTSLSTSNSTITTAVIFNYNLSSANIQGSNITELKFSFGGCWHGGDARSCDGTEGPGFNSKGGRAYFVIANGSKFEPIGDPASLGSYLNSTASNYAEYSVSKKTGFSDSYLQGGMLRMLIITSGSLQDDRSIQQVIDYALVEVTYTREV